MLIFFWMRFFIGTDRYQGVISTEKREEDTKIVFKWEKASWIGAKREKRDRKFFR